MTNITISGYTIHISIIFIIISILIYLINFLKNKNFIFARYFYYFSFFSILLSFFLLGYHFLTRDFRLSYVTSYSSSDLSILYTISAIWAGQEGSFLLWALLSLFLGIFLINYLKDDENLGMVIYNLQILGLLYLLLRQSPFVLLEETPPDGRGLNPLLLNPWMAIHPPFMFLGYAAYGIPFTFALLLALKRSFQDFYLKTYKWVIFSWVSMGTGIILGGFWAYETLGWGGYWGWDPVENASLIPWLLMTALIHGMILQKKYKTFYRSNFLLATFSFIFVLYGTFLTRSGVLQDFSVHSFVDLGITGVLLIFLLSFLILSLFIFFFTLKYFPKSEPIDSFYSKKSIIIYGILILIFSSFFVTIGTSSPIITKIFTEPSKVSNNFYINTHIPITIFLLLFLGTYPLIKNFKISYILLSIIIGLGFSIISFIFGITNPLHIFLIFLSFFAVIMQFIYYRLKNVFFLHFGAILFILGSIYSTGYDKNEKFKLVKGEPQKYGKYELKFIDFVFPEKGKSYGEIEIKKNNKKYILKPKLWYNEKTNQIISNPDIKKRFIDDIYFSIEQYSPEKTDEISFQKNESKNLYGLNILFKGFQISGSHGSGGSFEVNCLFDIEKGEEKKEASLTFSLGKEQKETKIDDNIFASVERIDATSGSILLHIRNKATKPFIVLSFMQIPLINLVWLSSLIIIFFGTVLFLKKD